MEGLLPQDLPLIPGGWQLAFQEEDTTSAHNLYFIPVLLLNDFLGSLLKAIQISER